MKSLFDIRFLEGVYNPEATKREIEKYAEFISLSRIVREQEERAWRKFEQSLREKRPESGAQAPASFLGIPIWLLLLLGIAALLFWRRFQKSQQELNSSDDDGDQDQNNIYTRINKLVDQGQETLDSWKNSDKSPKDDEDSDGSSEENK